MKDENKLSMAEFQPAEVELNMLAAKARAVDGKDIKLVHDVRIELRDTRIALAKKGKELRDGALQFQKKVIAKEKDLLAIIEPEEVRLEDMENEAKKRAEMEKRRGELPSRKAALEAIAGMPTTLTDDQLLEMTDSEFNEHRLLVIDAKLQKDKAEHEAKVKADEEAAKAKQAEADRISREKLDAEKAEFERQKKADEEKRRAEQAVIDQEKARLQGIEEERLKQEAAKRAETERLEKEARLRKEAEQAEADRIKKQKEEQAKHEDFVKFLRDIGYSEATDELRYLENGVVEVLTIKGTYIPKK